MADNQHSCEIAPGIFLIKVPLPENPLKQLNSYLILDEDRPTLVDVGFNRIECEQVLRRALDDFGLDFQDIDVLATQPPRSRGQPRSHLASEYARIRPYAFIRRAAHHE